MNKEKNKKAFTIIELIVVITIVSTLAVVSMFTYDSFVDKAVESKLIAQAKEKMDLDLIQANGDYNNIAPLVLTDENIDKYIENDFFGYYDNAQSTYGVVIENSLCSFKINENKWKVEDADEEIIQLLNIRKERLSFLKAEISIQSKASKITNYIYSIDSCPHNNMKISIEGTHKCFICKDCGLYGVDLKTQTIDNPTTSTTGVMKYTYIKNGTNDEFTRIIPKVQTDNWFWAFYNDQDMDGMPELDSYQYIDYTTVKYQYLYKAADFDDYPVYDLSLYGGLSDKDWNDFYEQYDQEYNDLYDELSKYNEGTQEYNSIFEDINSLDQTYSELENEYIKKDEVAYNKYLEIVKEYELSTNNLVNNINPSKTKVITEEQKLYYFLHIPFDYNPNKSYPVLVFYPGSGATLFSFYGTNTKGENTLQEGDFYYDKFRQTKANGLNYKYTNYSNSTMDQEGNWLDGQLTIRDGSWCGSFFSNWYNQVKSPGEGRDLYDCFILFIQPADSSWWSSGYYLSMTNQVNVPEIEGAFKITPEMTGDTAYKGYSRPTYDSSYVSASPDGQLACKLIDKMAQEYNIDLARQYVAGGSLGGAFTMDMINHYHDRFACGIPVVSASADLTEQTAKAIVKDGMNIWAISGDGDTNCNKYFSKLFVEGLNEAKNNLNIKNDYTYQFSFFPGGHSCAYIGGSLRNATQGVSITYANQALDFMFNSKKK